MIYQHASYDRDDALATALDLLNVEARAKVDESDRARIWHKRKGPDRGPGLSSWWS